MAYYLQKFVFLPPCYIYVITVSQFNLAPISFYVTLYIIKVDKM